MQKRKSISSRSHKNSSGVKLSWNPRTYDDAVELVRKFNKHEPILRLSARQNVLFYNSIKEVMLTIGELECPPPQDDRDGQYRTSPSGNYLVVERFGKREDKSLAD